ncbi:hypothetical protein SprV_0802546100 [Sparganum proliferum]
MQVADIVTPTERSHLILEDRDLYWRLDSFFTALIFGKKAMHAFSRMCFTGCRLAAVKTLTNSKLANRYQPLIREFKTSPSLKDSIRSRLRRVQPSEGPHSSPSLALDAGRAIILGGAAIGLGGLCYYGLYGSPSDSTSLSAFDRAAVWPDYVRQRIHSTYAYLAGGAAVAGASAVALARNASFVRVMTSGGLLAPLGMLAVSIGAGVVCQMVPYPENGGKFNTKHLAWLAYAASLGGVLAPICFIGGPILTRAAIYTGGIVGGLSAVAASAPSDRFLMWGGPLAMGLGVVFISSLGSMFLSPMGRLGAGLYAVSLYGGLVLFSGFLLYDTQLVVRRAEQHPAPNPYPTIYGVQEMRVRPFDPINNSIHILLDSINIFVRMVAILAGGGGRRK